MYKRDGVTLSFGKKPKKPPVMENNFQEITQELINEGFSPHLGKSLDFNITPYSLNTKLSFKFDHLAHFIEFLKLQDVEDLHEKSEALQTTLKSLNLDPNSFFYVNFFDKNKAVEET